MIRIAIADDHALVRAGLRQFLSDQSDLAVVAEAGTGREALDIVRAGQIDVLLLDIAMPDQSGVDALAAIRARAPELPVLVNEDGFYLSFTREPVELPDVAAVRRFDAASGAVTTLVGGASWVDGARVAPRLTLELDGRLGALLVVELPVDDIFRLSRKGELVPPGGRVGEDDLAQGVAAEQAVAAEQPQVTVLCGGSFS